MRTPDPTRFIGRVADVARLDGLFARGERLVTLLGPGGIGKTRLAAHYAARWAQVATDDAPAQAWFCELDDARDRDGLCAAVARALDVSLVDGDPVEQLGHAIAARGPALYVLDNFEHLLALAGATVGAWLAAAPEARLLVTSRERLRLAGEVACEVEPLGLPAPGATRPDDSEAVQLFVDRARALEPGFALGDDNAHEVAALMRKLEGIPLVIELAAGRIQVLGLGGLLARLPQSLDVLARGRRDADPRQATLRGAIEWSWNLLAPDEQRAFAQCAIFRGGFTLDAAEAVLAPRAAGAVPVIDVVHSLRDRSLLRSAYAGGPERVVRFAMYETLREFAAEKLRAAGELDATAERHARYYLGRERAWSPAHERVGAGAHLRDVLGERENLLAVAARGAGATPTTALEAALALDPLLAAQGPSGFHAELLARALGPADAGVAVEPGLLARALRARGSVHQKRGRIADARTDFDRALALARGAGDRRVEGTVLADLGVLHHQLREIARARALYEEALAVQRAAGDRRSEGRTLGNIGALHHDVGAFDAAREHYGRALAIFREVGEERLEGLFLTNRAILEHECSRADDAALHYEQALAILERVGDRRLAAIAAGNAGTLLHEQGRLEEARARHQEALQALREVGDLRSEALCLGRLGGALAALGRVDEARACVDLGERLLEPMGDRVALEAVRLDRAFLDLAPGGRGAAAARARIAAVDARPVDGAPSVRELSDDVRLTVRILEAALARTDAPVATAPEPASPDALVLRPAARGFRPPRGEWQDLSQYGPVRLMLLALVERHARAPGVGTSVDALRAAGWPDEKMLPEAGANRVYVALAGLRKRGLKPWLRRHDDGYLLEPAMPIEWVT